MSYDTPAVDLRIMLPVLECMGGLTTFEVSAGYAKLALSSGIEELAVRVPCLRSFKWFCSIDLDKNSEVQHLTCIFINVELTD